MNGQSKNRCRIDSSPVLHRAHCPVVWSQNCRANLLLEACFEVLLIGNLTFYDTVHGTTQEYVIQKQVNGIWLYSNQMKPWNFVSEAPFHVQSPVAVSSAMLSAAIFLKLTINFHVPEPSGDNLVFHNLNSWNISLSSIRPIEIVMCITSRSTSNQQHRWHLWFSLCLLLLLTLACVGVNSSGNLSTLNL